MKTISNSVEKVIENLMKYTHQKDLNKVLSLYSDTKEFKFIGNDGQVLNFNQLKEMYIGLFENLDYVKLLKSEVIICEENLDFACCIWQGKEKIKMKEADEVKSSWTATILMIKRNKLWKITHFHATHF